MGFKLIATADLGFSAFQEHSTWAQYYEPDDIDRLTRFGWDSREVRRLIEATGWSDDFWFPIPEEATPGTFEFERRHAEICLANQLVVHGYVENKGQAITVFGRTGRWVINECLLELFDEQLPAFRRDLGLASDANVLPAKVNVASVKWSFEFPRSHTGSAS